jgi:hypothetical protein
MDTLNLQLGHSELIYLLWLMKTLSLPGIGSKPFGGISGEQVMASLAAAEQSLQARGLIAVQDTGVRIDQGALILVGSCALAKTSLLVESQTKDAPPVALYFHYHSKAWVRRSLLEQGIHRFELIESPLPDCERLLVEVPSPNGTAPEEFTLPKVILDQVLDLFSRHELDEINKVLESAGLSAEVSAALIDTLSNLEQKLFVGVTYHNRSENMSGESIVVLRGPLGYWRLDHQVDTGTVKLIPLNPQMMREIFSRIVQQAQVP